MMLLLDVGNTSVKWAVQEAAGMSPGSHFQYQGKDFGLLAQGAWGELEVPEKIVVSNVAGSAPGNLLTRWMQHRWDVTPVFMQVTDKACGVTNAYGRPADLGVDRWAAIVGAHALTNEASCIVDCGTAITLDFLTVDGRHKGGVILPGINMLQQVLLENTAGIHLSNSPKFAAPYAQGTADAVHGGAIYMVAAAIDHIVEDMSAAAGTRPVVIITGGDAGQIQSLLSCSTRHDPDLVLKGLAILAGDS